ncbi:MAG TPA: hypothetical protein VF138_09970 [Caulobacteraceae bacterium]
MSASLAIVSNPPEAENTAKSVESLTDRIKRLQDEARGMAREHIKQLEQSMHEVARLAAEVADGGDAYPVGVREMARTLVTDYEARQLSLQAILHRSGNVH